MSADSLIRARLRVITDADQELCTPDTREHDAIVCSRHRGLHLFRSQEPSCGSDLWCVVLDRAAAHVHRVPRDAEMTTSRAAWRGADLSGRDWVYELTAREVDELRGAVEVVRAAGLALDGLRREDVPLPMLSPVIDGWADELDAGRGFVLVRGVPVDELGEDGAAIAYVALGVHLGVPVSQNAAGDLLGHVRDDGSDPDDPTVRRYRTRLAQPFHVDGSDVVGLLCLQPAKSGGLSQIVSSVTVFDEVARRRPDLSGRCCTSRGTSIATARSGPASGRGSPCRSCRGCRTGSGSSTCAGTSTRRRAIRTFRG